jgi:two-component SAPR family response regulator
MLAESCFLILLWKHDLIKVSLFFERIRPLMDSSSSDPICKIWMNIADSCFYWNCADVKKSVESAGTALRLAENTGFHSMSLLHIHFHTCIANLTTDRLEDARANLQDIQSLVIPGQLMHEVLYHQAAGVLAWHENDLNKAYEWIQRATDLSKHAGINFSSAFHLAGLSIILFEQGNIKDAERTLTQAESIARSEKVNYPLFDILLFKAYFQLKQGKRKQALEPLHEALDIGSKDHRIASVWWRPSVMSMLCATALEAEIHMGYVRLIINKRTLMPNPESNALEQWPWPLRIYTMGELRIEIDGELLSFGSKPPAKPLELLKTLIAMGGQKVKTTRLADRLWPDAEGDDALESFKITLRRLRKLLRHENILPLHECSLSLNFDYCWTDVHTLLQLSRRFSNNKQNQSNTYIASEIVRLYTGSFLGNEDIHSAIQLREQLRNTFLQAISHLGQFYESDKQWEQAIEYYNKGLQAEELTEIFYQHLIVCYQNLDLPAEALRVFNHCKHIFKRELGIEPSVKTQSLCRALVNI